MIRKRAQYLTEARVVFYLRPTVLKNTIFFSGIIIVGGEDSKRLDFGIYIKSITEGGAAWKDGRLKAGRNKLNCHVLTLEI